MTGRRPTWAAQVITFYHPAYWGLDSDEALADYAEQRPREFYDRLLDGVQKTGVHNVELCVPPGDWKTASAAYGSADSFVVALADRGLRLSGSYQIGWVLEDALSDDNARRNVLDDTRRHAEFLAACGTDLMLSGPPRRGVLEGSAQAIVSERSLEATATIFTDLARAARESGVRLAVHTEAYSTASREADIARLMQATEPGLVFLCPDAGHIALDGGRPENVIARHASRMTSMHWKDCIGERHDLPAAGAVSHEDMMEQFRTVGQGIVDWDEVIAQLQAKDFAGYAVAEIDLAPDPLAEVASIIDYYREHSGDAGVLHA